ncbi:MAG: helical backbone metal receptor [Thermoanaerobaculia bacterium]
MKSRSSSVRWKALLLLAVAVLTACSDERGPLAEGERTAERIIAVAPNIVELLYALDLGDRVVGVGNYSRWPPEVGTKPQIGGLFDARLERIVALQPDLAILLPSESGLADRLERLSIDTLIVPSNTLADVDESILAIAARCGVPERGGRLVEELRQGLEPCRLDRSYRVALVVGRQIRNMKEILVAGRGTFLNELLERLGAENVFAEAVAAYPQVAVEEFYRLRPDAIIELQFVPGGYEQLSLDWKAFPELPAVRNGCVSVIGGDHTVVPGARLPRLYAEIRQRLMKCGSQE